MMRYLATVAPALLAVLVLGACATGLPEGYDGWPSDIGAEDSYDALPDTSPDVPWDTYDPPPDTAPDAMDAPDSVDAPDTTDPAPEDVDTDPGTCTTADFVNQTMCSPGYKCTIGSVDSSGNPTPVCDLEGTQGYNETCTVTGSHDDCEAGYMCVGTSTDSRCRRFCASDTICRSSPGGANAACEITLVAGSVTIVGVTMCSFHCDPLSAYSSGCDTTQACRGIGLTSGVWMTDCRSYGSGAGTGCAAGTEDDCPKGEGCFNDGVEDLCLAYCRYPSGTPGCSYPETCTSLTDWPTWIGVCYY